MLLRTASARWPALFAGTCARKSGCDSSYRSNQEDPVRILIVEDDAQVAKLMSLVLERNGHRSDIVSDGQSALDRARSHKPDMIFADLTIRGMGGEQLCNALKSTPATKDIPYVVVSG